MATLVVAGALSSVLLQGLTSHGPSTTAIVDSGNVESAIKADGKLEPSAYIDVGSQVSGQVTQLLKREGDTVAKGEVVAVIDDTLAQGLLKDARGTYDQLMAQHLAQLAAVSRNEQRAVRYRGLLERDAIAQEEVEFAENSLDSAQAELHVLEAQIQQAEANIDNAKAQLGYTVIRSPIAGVVVAIYVREGQTLLASQSVPQVMKVADMNSMRVIASVLESNISKLKLGQEAYFTVESQPGRRWDGRLRQINPVGQRINGKVYYQAKFEVDNDGSLMSEMTAQIYFVADRVDATTRVPLEALRARSGDLAELVVVKGDRSVTRQVRLGLIGDKWVSVVSGLQLGEVVVMSREVTSSALSSTAE